MHLHLESCPSARSDCPIHALSWMGKVPDDMPEEEGWKLNRVLYYQEGWLATGNARGIVGVTYSSSHCKRGVDVPARTNYNLHGHRAEVRDVSTVNRDLRGHRAEVRDVSTVHHDQLQPLRPKSRGERCVNHHHHLPKLSVARDLR
ncbi:tubby-related protein 4-like [Hyalella azteca]|uniref:Tubby-related protein 4-like n=1 Tax=Hyalella azteca TaxID=294128 RepID=A0A979FUT6_HYAAZ|nr:tubby-related protein 4-like [Hyalella azteca]